MFSLVVHNSIHSQSRLKETFFIQILQTPSKGEFTAPLQTNLMKNLNWFLPTLYLHICVDCGTMTGIWLYLNVFAVYSSYVPVFLVCLFFCDPHLVVGFGSTCFQCQLFVRWILSLFSLPKFELKMQLGKMIKWFLLITSLVLLFISEFIMCNTFSMCWLNKHTQEWWLKCRAFF